MFWKKKKAPEIQLIVVPPEIIGLRLGGAIEFDPLKLKLISDNLTVSEITPTQMIEAVGEVFTDVQSQILRFYTDDEGFLQVNFDGEKDESNITDVKMWYFYDTRSIDNQVEWDKALNEIISQPKITLEGKTYTRVWKSTGTTTKPIALTEKTYLESSDPTCTDQFIMLYEREVSEGNYEYVTQSAEEKIINNQYDRCFVTSTGFDINPTDITIT
jgi:hypothetical protein